MLIVKIEIPADQGVLVRSAALLPKSRERHLTQGAQTARGGILLRHGGQDRCVKGLRNPPVFQEDQPVGQICQIIQPMLRHYDGSPLALPQGKNPPQLLDARLIQVGGRLVQYHDLRLRHGHRRAGDFLLLPAGESKDAAVHQVFQLHLPDYPADVPADLVRLHAEVFRSKGQLAGGVHIEELTAGILEDAAHMGRKVADPGRGHVQAADRDRTCQLALIVMGHKAVDEAGDRGLAAAGISGEHHKLALLDRETQSIYAPGPLLLAEGVGILIVKGYVLKLNHRSTSI